MGDDTDTSHLAWEAVLWELAVNTSTTAVQQLMQGPSCQLLHRCELKSGSKAIRLNTQIHREAVFSNSPTRLNKA